MPSKKQIIQEIYGENDDMGKEINDIIGDLKDKYGEDWVDHLDEIEDS